jgi:ribonuclease G
MFNELIVNTGYLEKRIALLEDNRLVELFAEKKENQILVGNIYVGIVKNVLPGMGAAFIDIGLSRTAFLHFTDIDSLSLNKIKKKIFAKRNSSDIGKILSVGQEIIVQVKKEPIFKKGARVTGKLSIPGKFLVFMPGEKKVAISRKISSSSERTRIKKILKKIKDKDVGIIVRTDTESINEEDFKREYVGIERTWKLINKQAKHAKPPACIYDENDISFSLVRDIFNSSIDRMVVDDKKMRNKLVSKLKDIAPELIDRIELYQEDSPIFNAYGIEKEINNIFKSRVNLPSGGNITIQQTEALVAIDVNTGSFTGKNDYEKTIAKTNTEAAVEAALQIRLRDLSGIMVIDFIDMKNEKDRDKVYNTLKNTLKKDRAKHQVFPFSPLGLIEISRKRTRPSLLLSYSEQCPHCHGTGRLISRDSIAIQILRWLKRANYFIKKEDLTIKVHKNVKKFIDENPHLFDDIQNTIIFVSDGSLEFDKFKVISTKTNKEFINE